MNEININDIFIPERKRILDKKKVAALASSIQEIGLLNPISVYQLNGTYYLCAGRHRLEAFKELHRTTIPVNVLEQLDAELIEIDENLLRNNLTFLEDGEHLIRRNEILIEKGLRRGRGGSGSNQYESKTALGADLQTSDIAEQVGMSERSIYYRITVARDIVPEVKDKVRHMWIADSKTNLVTLSQLEEDMQHRTTDKVLSGEAKNIITARKLIMREDVADIVPPTGTYQVIYADPPWEYEFGFDIHGAALRHYNTMSIEELCELPIKELADDNAVLFLWTTSPKLEQAFDVINAWGFEYKTSFVWDKEKHVMGHYSSVRHEFLLLATRGSYPKQSNTLHDSVINIPRSDEHSEKPEYFRQLIEEMYPKSAKIELFARTQADGWEVWGSE